MDLLFALPLLTLPVLLPLLAGLMAKSFGRKFWLWYCISIPLPFIAHILLLCLRDRSSVETGAVKPVENEEIFDYLFVEKPERILRADRLVKHRNYYHVKGLTPGFKSFNSLYELHN